MNATIQQNEINNAPAGLAPTGANVPHSRSTVLLLYNPFASPLQTETLISFIITSISFVRGHTIGTKPHYSFVLHRVVIARPNPLSAFSPLSFSVNFLFLLLCQLQNWPDMRSSCWSFCPSKRQFKSIAEGGDQDAEMAPKCDGYWSQPGGIFTAAAASFEHSPSVFPPRPSPACLASVGFYF